MVIDVMLYPLNFSFKDLHCTYTEHPVLQDLPDPPLYSVHQQNMMFEFQEIRRSGRSSSRFHLEQFLLKNYSLLQSDPKIRREFYNSYFHMDKQLRSRNFSIFGRSWIDRYGLIVNRDDCRTIRNGACPHDRDFCYNEIKKEVHPVVISLASGWSATWHFPMESLVALANIDLDLFKRAKFHLPNTTPNIINWMKMIGIGEDRVISGTIAADILLIPQPGRCGYPYVSQLNWMVEKFKKTSVVTSPRRKLVYVRRRSGRTVTNEIKLYNFLLAFGNQNNIDIVSHDDFTLPALQEQVNTFSEASIVVAPHGAGQMFMNYMDPYTFVLELIKPDYPVFCYSYIAFVRKLNYEMQQLYRDFANLTTINASLVNYITLLETDKHRSAN